MRPYAVRRLKSSTPAESVAPLHGKPYKGSVVFRLSNDEIRHRAAPDGASNTIRSLTTKTRNWSAESMADSEDTDAAGAGNDDDAAPYEMLGLIYETRVLTEAVATALETMHRRSQDPGVKEQFAVLRKLVTQSAEAMETLQRLVMKTFRLDTEPGHA
jgi:hypothetical protein